MGPSAGFDRTAGFTGVVLLGSSRVFFNFQLPTWEEVSGTRPVMLAVAGSSPIPVFKDIVENSSFNGTLVIGIALMLTMLLGGLWHGAAWTFVF